MQFGRVPKTFGSVASVLTTEWISSSSEMTSSVIIGSEAASQKAIIKESPRRSAAQIQTLCLYNKLGG